MRREKLSEHRLAANPLAASLSWDRRVRPAQTIGVNLRGPHPWYGRTAAPGPPWWRFPGASAVWSRPD